MKGRASGQVARKPMPNPRMWSMMARRSACELGSRAVGHDRAHGGGVAAKEARGGWGAVGPAEEIDLVVTEPGAHLVDVVHAEGGGVEPQVGDLGEAVAAPADGPRRKEIARQQL